jgi:hypothetical protein
MVRKSGANHGAGLQVRGGFAVVQVRAEGESQAREVVVSSALGSTSAEDIKLANQAAFIMGKVATLVLVAFSVEEDTIKLIEIYQQQ